MLWNILLYWSFMYATILSVDYWTNADNNVCWVLYCYEIFYYIVHSCMPQYCLLTTERMLTIMYVECHIALQILLYCLFMWATILFVDYWCMLTIMSVEYYIAIWNNITILYPWEPQYCLMTTDICWQYSLLSTIAMKYFIFDSLTTTQQCYYYHSNQQSPS